MKATGKKNVFQNNSGCFHLVFPRPLAEKKTPSLGDPGQEEMFFKCLHCTFNYQGKKNVVERELQILLPFIQLILKFWILIWHQLQHKKKTPTFQESFHLKGISRMRGAGDGFQEGTEYF